MVKNKIKLLSSVGPAVSPSSIGEIGVSAVERQEPRYSSNVYLYAENWHFAKPRRTERNEGTEICTACPLQAWVEQHGVTFSIFCQCGMKLIPRMCSIFSSGK